MTATAAALDAFLGDLSKPVDTQPAGDQRLAVFNDGKKWKASYRTAFGFRHVDLGTVTTIHSQAEAEAVAAEKEAGQ